ncbi:DNA-directed RNA polymerase subunit beta' [Candidatus Uhrbacteria bacterium RIFOXYA2_FULL_41_8]|nr:MAG: DNA-directed RNA polymerase subunit beta' [Candidatus Uhrbacteria bacterium RIFOXYA2_FULL_41_8]
MALHQINALKVTDFDSIRLRLASPESIRAWSYGEVSKPETINYRTQKPEKHGLFAEEIFGPSKDWECYCGKYKKIRYKGIICDKCGVEVTQAVVRRERMGHVDLCSPVTHIWFLRGVPSKIGTILDMSVQALERVIYFSSFVITDINQVALEQTIEQVRAEYKSKKKMIDGERNRDIGRVVEKFQDDVKAIEAEKARINDISDKKLAELEEDFLQVDQDLKEMKVMKVIPEVVYQDWSIRFGHIFDAGIGAEAVLKLLERMDVDATIKILDDELEATKSRTKHDRIIRRLKLLKSLKKNNLKPDWMVLRALPIIPADLRPMVALDGGRFATSDLNDLYRRVINRNNRLKRLHALSAPEVITRNEKRMLQEAVDSLIDNSARSSKTVIAATGRKRQLKSLADILKGKQGRFRQNLLGKRIDYSGRSVIVVGPHLRIDQCGIPKKMALELFRPFVISKLIGREYVHNIRSANRFIESDRPEVWDILEEVVSHAFVMLNRAPTLHRLGIQAFRPVLIEGKAIQVHPMVCDAFNADFDGDQMAVHVPLTKEANREAEELMLATHNLLKPSHGGPVATPGKDIAWGAYYLTMVEDEPDETNLKSFPDATQAKYAYYDRKIKLHQWIRVRLNGQLLITTVGRIILNERLPEFAEYQNTTVGKKILADVVRETLERHGSEFTAILLDDLKEMGFYYAQKSGYSWGMSELPEIKEKHAIIADGNARVIEIEQFYAQGLLTQSERKTQIVKVWAEVKDKIADLAKKALPAGSSAYTMIDSGARGSWGQMTQMIGMIGLKASASGETIELPVKSSFKEGVDVLEFFISSHGQRKGLTDTALKTANAGYLTRRLVDVAQDVVVRTEDCGDEEGMVITAKQAQELGETIYTRILGRTALKPIIMPGGRKVVVEAGQLITEDHIRELQSAKKELEEAHIRYILTCKEYGGVCKKCYGYDLAHNKPVKMGTSVGIIAAQSIGEPGTQLTMRTFHTGGVAGKDITSGLPRVEELFEARMPKQKAIMTEVSGKVQIERAERTIEQVGTGKKIVDARPGQTIIRIRYAALEEKRFAVGRGGKLMVKDGDAVKAGDVLGQTVTGEKILSDVDGTVVAKKTTLSVTHDAPKVREYVIPQGYTLYVKDNDEVLAGDALTEGHLDLQALFKYKGREAVEEYILNQITEVYASQGQKLNSKHIEIISRQMFSRIRIIDANDSDFLPGEVLERVTLMRENARLKANKQKPAVYEDLFLGITKISLSTESWLSAASFQETARVLIGAAVTGKVDTLAGLKENVIIGRLIPAGTGYNKDYIDMPEVVEEIVEEEADEEIKSFLEEETEAGKVQVEIDSPEKELDEDSGGEIIEPDVQGGDGDDQEIVE